MKIKGKMQCIFTVYIFQVVKVKICKVQPPEIQIFYFLLFLAFTLTDIIFHEFLEKDFCHKFPFFNGFLIKTHPSHPPDGKVFVDAPMSNQISFQKIHSKQYTD